MENEFPKRGDVDQDLSLFEIEDQNDLLVPSQVGDIHENVPGSPNPSGNDDGKGVLVQPNHQPRCSSWGQVPRWHFEIDGEELMTIL